MHDIVDVIERPIQTIAVPHVADEVANARVLVLPELLLHLELLQLVAAEDDQLARPIPRQHHLGKPLSERTGATGDNYDLVI